MHCTAVAATAGAKHCTSWRRRRLLLLLLLPLLWC
jgi:hypothetical protein